MKTQENPTMKRNSVTSLVFTGMLAAIIAVLSQIAIPLPSGVPVTLQTFAIALTAYLVGWKYGSISIIVYILLGVFGLPVFTGFKGGISALFGKTGGFIIGFIIMGLLCGLGFEYRGKCHSILLIVLSLAGLCSCHLLGIIQFSLLTHIDFKKSALLVSIPFLLKDIISIVCAYFFSLTLHKALKHSN